MFSAGGERTSGLSATGSPRRWGETPPYGALAASEEGAPRRKGAGGTHAFHRNAEASLEARFHRAAIPSVVDGMRPQEL